MYNNNNSLTLEFQKNQNMIDPYGVDTSGIGNKEKKKDTTGDGSLGSSVATGESIAATGSTMFDLYSNRQKEKHYVFHCFFNY